MHSVFNPTRARHSRESGNPEKDWIPPSSPESQFIYSFILAVGALFLLTACSSLPFFGKKKEKETDKTPAGKRSTSKKWKR